MSLTSCDMQASKVFSNFATDDDSDLKRISDVKRILPSVKQKDKKSKTKNITGRKNNAKMGQQMFIAHCSQLVFFLASLSSSNLDSSYSRLVLKYEE